MRQGEDGPELLLIHRPKYDDWSFPKGKLDPGESFREAALREVLEETGLICSLGASLPTTLYRDARERLKEVRYWLMEVVSGEVEERAPDREVDGWQWTCLEEARSRLTYERDRELVEAAERIHRSQDA
jgi:8-oxo-dGTP diphosphatase